MTRAGATRAGAQVIAQALRLARGGRGALGALGAMMVAGCLLALGPARAWAQEAFPADLVDTLAERAQERLRTLRAEADALVLEERTLLRQLRQLELARQIANEAFQSASAGVVAAEAAMAAADARTRLLEDERDREGPALESRLVNVYKLGRGRYTRLLLSTANLQRIGQASRAVVALAARDRARLAAFQSGLRALEQARAALDAERRALDARRHEALSAETSARQAIAAKNALVKDIDGQRDVNARLATELDAARTKLETTVSDAGGSATPIGLPIGPFRGVLPWPIPQADAPSHKAQARAGITVVTAEGTPVTAVHDGVVVFAGSFEGFGNLVIVDHGARAYSLYGDLLELAVGRGVGIARGGAIGRSGTAPAGGPGLYFELRVAGRTVDPLLWLTRVKP